MVKTSRYRFSVSWKVH